MIDIKKMTVDINKKVDTKEFEFPETIFSRDIENRVFQGIVLQCLSNIEGITLVEGTFIDNLLGRASTENVKGISAEQDNRSHSVSIKLEVNILYGISIPEKAEEIQIKIADEVTRLTGLHVSAIHIVFKNMILSPESHRITPQAPSPDADEIDAEYSEEF